nr:hypothetical protein [Tanacetum cinerariifolium]
MAITEDEPSVGKGNARSGQRVEITMKKVQRLHFITDGDERKHVLDYTHVDFHFVEDQRKNLLSKFNSLNLEFKVTLDQLLTEQVPGNIVRALGGRGKKKDYIFSNEILFSKTIESPFKTVPEITFDSESECNNLEPLPPLPKLIEAEPIDTSANVITLVVLTQTLAVSEEYKKVPDKKLVVKTPKKKAQTVSLSVSDPSTTKKANSFTEQLLLRLIEEGCYMKQKCSTCGSTDHLTKEHPKQVVFKKTLAKLKAQSYKDSSSRKAHLIPKPSLIGSTAAATTITLMSVCTTLDVTSMVALLMKPLTVLRNLPLTRGKQGSLVSD